MAGKETDPADRADAIEALAQTFMRAGKTADESRQVATKMVDLAIKDRQAGGGSSKTG